MLQIKSCLAAAVRIAKTCRSFANSPKLRFPRSRDKSRNLSHNPLKPKAVRAFCHLVRNIATSTKLLLALTAIAVAVLQMVGAVRGYWCLCGGEPTVVAIDHCHGPHGAQCHDNGQEDRHRHDGSDGDTEQHAAAKSELEGSVPPTTSIFITAPVLVPLLAIIDLGPLDGAAAIQARAPDVRGSPPLSVAVVRAVVFLI